MTCYTKANSTVIYDTSQVFRPCSPITDSNTVSPCCPTKDLGALCLSFYLCWWPEVNTISHFVTASCTDELYESGECTPHCTDQPNPDVIYDYGSGLWHCCGHNSDGITDCANPTDETFAAPAPSVLLAAASALSTIISTSTSSALSSTETSTSSNKVSSTTTSSTSSPTSATSASSSSSSFPSLSTGAKVGIAIGAVLIVALLATAFFFTWRHGKKSRRARGDESLISPSASPQKDAGPIAGGYGGGGSGGAARYRDYNPEPVEMLTNSASNLSATGFHGARNGPAEL